MDGDVLDLPDTLLIFEILPKLNLRNLLRLCQSNSKLNTLCSYDELWRTKVSNDFPNKIVKPENYTWREWYLSLATKKIPMTLNGDVVGFTTLLYDNNNIDLSYVFPDVNKLPDGDKYSLFLLNGINPVVVEDYTGERYILPNENQSFEQLYDKINRVLLIRDFLLANYKYTEEQPKQLYKLRIITKRSEFASRSMLDTEIKSIIRSNLFSRLGNPPIYGVHNLQLGNFTLLYYVEYQLGFVGDICSRIPERDLLNIANTLMGNHVGSTNKNELCMLIRQELEEIGHVITVNS